MHHINRFPNPKPRVLHDFAFIYLIQDGNDRGSNIFKIGKTTQGKDDSRSLTRLKQYSKGTIQHATFSVPYHQVDEIETLLINHFRQKYVLVRGREWFAGDMYEMRRDCQQLIDQILDVAKNKDSDDTVVVRKKDDILQELFFAEASNTIESIITDTSDSSTNKFQCHLCDYTSNRKANLERHANLHCDLSEREPHACQYCQRIFSTKANLQRHQQLSCMKYGKACLSEVFNALNMNVDTGSASNEQHVMERNVHAISSDNELQSNNRSYPCEGCYKAFATKRSLDRHNCKHISHPLQCHKCLRILASVSAKSHHVKVCKKDKRP